MRVSSLLKAVTLEEDQQLQRFERFGSGANAQTLRHAGHTGYHVNIRLNKIGVRAIIFHFHLMKAERYKQFIQEALLWPVSYTHLTLPTIYSV